MARRSTSSPWRTVIASNNRALHDYTILKQYEAGIVLIGDEVKSLRAGCASLVGAFAQEHLGELMLYGMHIGGYANANRGIAGRGNANRQPQQARKLLLHRQEIARILDRLREPGITLVPLSLYFRDGWAKVELGLARGNREYDKRQILAKRDANREMARAMGRHLKGRTDRVRRSKSRGQQAIS